MDKSYVNEMHSLYVTHCSLCTIVCLVINVATAMPKYVHIKLK